MNHPHRPPRVRYAAQLVSALSLLGGCATAPGDSLADGSALRDLIVQQTHDPEASARNGTTAPVGTDPDVANAAVQAVRSNSGRASAGAPRSSAIDIVTGSRSR